MNGEAIGDMSFGQECPREDVKARRSPMPSVAPPRPAGRPERLNARRKVELLT